MTPVRAGVSLFLLGAICLLVVFLRAEKVRLDAASAAHEQELLNLRRATWNVQMQIARLRAPEQIQDRVRRMRLGVQASFSDLIGPYDNQAQLADGN